MAFVQPARVVKLCWVMLALCTHVYSAIIQDRRGGVGKREQLHVLQAPAFVWG
jgi:hypothetical protein